MRGNSKRSESTLSELIKAIKAEIPYVDRKPYSHNIISLNLRMIDADFGMKAANRVIRDLGLNRLGWVEMAGEAVAVVSPTDETPNEARNILK